MDGLRPWQGFTSSPWFFSHCQGNQKHHFPLGELLWPALSEASSKKLSINNKFWKVFNPWISISKIKDNRPLKSLSVPKSCHHANSSEAPGLPVSLLSLSLFSLFFSLSPRTVTVLGICSLFPFPWWSFYDCLSFSIFCAHPAVLPPVPLVKQILFELPLCIRLCTKFWIFNRK